MRRSNMARHVRRGAKEVSHAAKQVKSSANHQAHTVLRAVDKVRSEVADALKDGYEDLRDVAAGYVEQGRDTARSLEETFEERVAKRPLAAIGAAIGFGFILGIFFRRH